MTLFGFYILTLAGYFVARAGLRRRGGPARIVLALLGAAFIVVPALVLGRGLTRAADVLRFGLSAVAIVAAAHIVIGERPVHCALALLVVFLCLAGIFVAFQAEFLAAITISINAGAVVVTFLFILMLIDVRLDRGVDTGAGWVWPAVALAAVFTVLVAVTLAGARPANSPPEPWFRMAGSAYGSELMNTRLKAGAPSDGADEFQWLNELPPGEAKRMRSGRPYPLRPISGYTRHIGWELYTKYTVPFEVASLILTIAVVGAVAIGRQGRAGEVRGGGL